MRVALGLYIGRSLAMIIIFGMIISGCAPSKNTFTRRAYHNVTSKYNALFNGQEAYKEAIAELYKVAEDDYARILPVFKSPTDIQAQSQSSQLDKATQKSATVIQRHSFALRMKTSKEYCKYIDDCYLLIGKSYFAKQNYREAAETFEFVSKEYNDPIKYDALLWLVQAKLKQNKTSECLSILDMVSSKQKKGELSKYAIKTLPLVYAEYYLKEQQYDLAIDYLRMSLNMKQRKKVNYRLNFILAQVLQKQGKFAEAGKLYDKVISMNPPYVMAFNARINMAKCYDGTGAQGKTIKAELQKMLKDGKNIEFLDQIYHTLGEISLKEKDTAQALSFFKLASANSVKNNFQKASTLLTVADLYYTQLNYENAQIYYDSTLQFLAKDHPDLVEISDKNKLLLKLVENIQIITLEDSLQKLGKMSERDRSRAVDNIMAEIKRKEEQQKQEEALKLQQLAQLKQQSREMDAGNLGGGGWYFYNTSAMSFGYNEFIKKWGKRKLEDLWLLKDKKAIDIALNEEGQEGAEGSESDTAKTVKDEVKDKNYYLKQIPTSEADLKASDEKVMEAMYNVGYTYYEGLQDYPRSTKTFDKLITRYPQSDYVVKSYYYLYKIYLEKVQDKAKADYYKSKILNEYPETDYARILKDPTYGQNRQNASSKQSILYQSAYSAYQEGQFERALAYCREGMAIKENNELLPSFLYIQAISNAKLGKKDLMKQQLNEFLSQYPKHEIAPLAQNLLDYETDPDGYLKTIKPISPSDMKVMQQLDEYTVDSSAVYLFMMEVDITKHKVTDVQNALSDFNAKNYSLIDLTVSNVVFSKTIQILTVSNFKGIENAMEYYNNIANNFHIIKQNQTINYKPCMVSTQNYNNVVRNRNNATYYDFFRKNYLGSVAR